MQYVSVRYKQSARLYEAGPTWETKSALSVPATEIMGRTKQGHTISNDRHGRLI